jgi:hypothetical protein
VTGSFAGPILEGLGFEGSFVAHAVVVGSRARQSGEGVAGEVLLARLRNVLRRLILPRAL